MKIKSLFVIAVVAITMVACNNASQDAHTHNHDGEEHSHDTEQAVEAKDFAISLEESVVDWRGSIIGIKYHSGVVDFQSGSLSMAGDKVVGGSFVVDLSTMRATDDDNAAGYGEGNKEQLIGHLSSADFFDVANHPTASFEITSVDGNKLMGNLTIRGNTSEETVDNLQVVEEGGMYVASGDLTFDRQKYDVAWDSGVKDVVMSDDIELKISLKVAK